MYKLASSSPPWCLKCRSHHEDLDMLRSVAWIFSLTASLASCSYPTAAPIAHVKNGSYVGRYSPEYHQDYFLGIPYAQPPVGSLRFRNPVGLNTSWSDARPAAAYSEVVFVAVTSSEAKPTNVKISATATARINGTTRSRRTAST